MVLSYSLCQSCMILSLLPQNLVVLSIHFRTAWSSPIPLELCGPLSVFKNIFYWLCYYSSPIFSPLYSILHPPPTSIPPTLVHVHGSYM